MRIRHFFMLVCIFALYTSVQAVGTDSVDIHGFISQGFFKTSDNNYFADTEEGSFQFNEMGINFTSKLTPRLRIGLQLFAHDLGDLGNDEVTLDWVFGDYRWREWFGIRVGKIKNPIGLYNEVRDIDMVRTFITLPQSVYQEKYRESWVAVKGAGIYGKVGSDVMGTLGYQLQIGSMEASKESGGAKHFESLLGFFEVTTDYDIGITYGGKLDWQTPVIPLRLSASALLYDFDITAVLKDEYLIIAGGAQVELKDETDLYRVLVGSAEYVWENLVLVFEYSEIYSDANLYFSPETLFTSGPLETTMQGYYGSISYRFFDWLELGTYYSVYYPDKDDKDGENMVAALPFKEKFQAWSKDACLSIRFDINMNWIVKLEAHVMNGAADLFDMDNYDEDTPILNFMPNLDIEEDWMLYAMKLSYTF